MKKAFAPVWLNTIVGLSLVASLADDLAAQTLLELVTVVDSVSIYDPSSYTVHCHQWYVDEKSRCIRVARPDKPFPLPTGFLTSVRRQSGEIQTFESVNGYRAGVRINIQVTE